MSKAGEKLIVAAREAIEVARCDHELEPIDSYATIEKATVRVCRKCGARFTSYRKDCAHAAS